MRMVFEPHMSMANFDSDDPDDIAIPAASISLASYIFLNSFLSTHHAPVLINIRSDPLEDLSPVARVIVVAILFLAVGLWVVIECRNSKTAERHASSKDIRRLPCRRWTGGPYDERIVAESPKGYIHPGYHLRTHHDVLLECVVCLEDFQEGDLVLTLPCDHDFHKLCM